MKEKVREEYLRRVKAVAKSYLYSRNLFTAINVWAVSVVRYTAGILDWTQKEIKDLDIKTRKILTMNGVFHKKGNVDRLYLNRDAAGRGLISIEDCVALERLNLRNYLLKSPEPLLRAANGILFPEDLKFRQDNVDDGNERVEDVVEENFDGIEQTRLQSGSEYKTDVSDQRVQDLVTKTMHGEWFRGVSTFASQRTFDWVKKGYLDKRTEGFLFAAQEQALQTNWLKGRWKGEDWDRRCRKCREFPEKVSHIISGCSK